jgi:hypothetical protein
VDDLYVLLVFFVAAGEESTLGPSLVVHIETVSLQSEWSWESRLA